MPRISETSTRILVPCLLSLLAGCITTSSYSPPSQGAIATIRFETTEARVVNAEVRLYTRRGCEEQQLVGLLNSRLVGMEYRSYLDTRITANQPITVSVFSPLYRDIGAMDVLTLPAETITAGLGYCETYIHFTPQDGHQYRAIYNAQHRGCDMDIYEIDNTGKQTLLPDLMLDSSCELKPIGNAQVYNGILSRDYSEY